MPAAVSDDPRGHDSQSCRWNVASEVANSLLVRGFTDLLFLSDVALLRGELDTFENKNSGSILCYERAPIMGPTGKNPSEILTQKSLIQVLIIVLYRLVM